MEMFFSTFSDDIQPTHPETNVKNFSVLLHLMLWYNKLERLSLVNTDIKSVSIVVDFKKT
jgi:hypothetical protein